MTAGVKHRIEVYERNLVNTVNVGAQGIALRWRNRPPLLSRDWECNDPERQMRAAHLNDDEESRSPVRESKGYVRARHCKG